MDLETRIEELDCKKKTLTKCYLFNIFTLLKKNVIILNTFFTAHKLTKY
jgi:hypothetical protein